MAIILEKLPYEINALEPYISKETIEYHYGKHHKTYVDNLNKLIIGSELENKTLQEIICISEGAIFNNAAQIVNHDFYWKCLSPNRGKQPSGKLLQDINQQFGSFEKFKEKFSNSCLSLFGSGWTWLIQESNGDLVIVNTSNAQTQIKENKKVLLTCDVWEHAYYIDYRNLRAKYVEAFWNIINWEFVENL